MFNCNVEYPFTAFLYLSYHMEWQHQYAELNGIKYHYVEAGEGPLIVLMHGFPEFWYSWRKQIPVLAQAGFKVVAPDMRGYNETDKPEGVANYDIELIQQDMIALVKHLGYEKAVIVGHDWGGGVAWQLGQDHPEIIDKLIILNCPPVAVLFGQLLTNPKQMLKSWYIFMFQIPGLPERRMQNNLREVLTRGYRGWSHNKDAFIDADIDEYIKAFDRPYGISGPINWYRAAMRNMKKKQYRNMRPVNVDTLVIWGEDDRALGKELTYNFKKYCTKGYDIKYIPNCSHWVQNDAAEQVNEYLLEYLKQ